MIGADATATLVINQGFHPGLAPLFLDAAREVMAAGSLLEAEIVASVFFDPKGERQNV